MFRGPGHFMGAELEGEIPSYAEHDDFLVKVPALKELLCRGGSVIALAAIFGSFPARTNAW